MPAPDPARALIERLSADVPGFDAAAITAASADFANDSNPALALATWLAASGRVEPEALNAALRALPQREKPAPLRDRFGPYQVLQRLGSGGMGAVWEVEHVETGAHYALKRVVARLGNLEALQRFRVEAEALASLDHPNVVRVHAAELAGREPYLVQELLDESLQDVLSRRGALPVEDVVRIARDLLAALRYLHAHGVVHRDLKPANVLFDGDGRAKVADFGLARRLGEAALRLTETGDVLGTPAFMAPEQAFDVKASGPAADVYALGGVVYAMLTGVPPFSDEGQGALMLLARLHKEPAPRPQVLRPDSPKHLSQLCAACLEKAPARRPSLSSVERMLAGEALPGSLRRVAAGALLAAAVALGTLAAVVVRSGPAEPTSGATPTSTPDVRFPDRAELTALLEGTLLTAGPPLAPGAGREAWVRSLAPLASVSPEHVLAAVALAEGKTGKASSLPTPPVWLAAALDLETYRARVVAVGERTRERLDPVEQLWFHVEFLDHARKLLADWQRLRRLRPRSPAIARLGRRLARSVGGLGIELGVPPDENDEANEKSFAPAFKVLCAYYRAFPNNPYAGAALGRVFQRRIGERLFPPHAEIATRCIPPVEVLAGLEHKVALSSAMSRYAALLRVVETEAQHAEAVAYGELALRLGSEQGGDPGTARIVLRGNFKLLITDLSRTYLGLAYFRVLRDPSLAAKRADLPEVRRALELAEQGKAISNPLNAREGEFTRGLALVFAGDLDGAQSELDALQARFDRDGSGELESHMLAAELAMVRGDFARACVILVQLSRHVQNRAEVQYACAHALAALGDPEAERYFNWGRTVQWWPDDFLGFAWHRSSARARRLAAGEAWWPGAERPR